jgi:hypothetical protein
MRSCIQCSKDYLGFRATCSNASRPSPAGQMWQVYSHLQSCAGEPAPPSLQLTQAPVLHVCPCCGSSSRQGPGLYDAGRYIHQAVGRL